MQAKLARAPSVSNGKRRQPETPHSRRPERTHAGKSVAATPRANGLSNPGQRLPETSPVERRSGVGLSARCDVDMPNDIDNRISSAQSHEKFRQTHVLPVGVGLVVDAFELHSDGEVVTALASPPSGSIRPRAVRENALIPSDREWLRSTGARRNRAYSLTTARWLHRRTDLAGG